MAEEKHSQRREFGRLSRAGRNQKAVASNILESISQFTDGELAVLTANSGDRQLKILVKKEDLKQVLEAIRDGKRAGSFEQRLNLMRRRHLLRAANQVRGRCRGSWSPVLQTIPEEL